MQPDEFVRTREREKGTKAKSLKSRCDKVDARIGKEVPGGGFDIDHVMILLQRTGFIFKLWAPLDSYGRKGAKLPN
jgi:hypothetical protein